MDFTVVFPAVGCREVRKRAANALDRHRIVLPQMLARI